MSKPESTGRPRDPELEQRWRRHVAAWRERSISAKAYCEEQGLSVPSLYAWSRKLAARDAGLSSGKSSARFVAVDVRDASGGGAWIEIATDGTIRVPVELDAERLAAVLDVVRRAMAC